MKSSPLPPGSAAAGFARGRWTIISFMLSILAAHEGTADQHLIAHAASFAALFVGFCLTLLGISLLLYSQNLDAQGLGRPWPFTLGAVATYLALSQTVTAFMHDYLLVFSSVVDDLQPGVPNSGQDLIGLGALDHGPLLILVLMASVIWVVITYAAPLFARLRSPIRVGARRLLTIYYFTLQVPIYWVYAYAWQLQYASSDRPANILSLFGLQFVQPLLWLR